MPRAHSDPLRLLVIDDHELSMIVLRTNLRQRGYTCEGVMSADEGVEVLAQLRPQVVLYEWNLRCNRGDGLAQRLRDASKDPTLVLIAVSTLDEPEGFLAAEGVDGYVRKPFDIEMIQSLLRRLCVGD